MKWEGERESSNVEDERGGGGFGGFPIGGRGASLGCGGLIILLLVSWFTGINPLSLLNMVQGTGARSRRERRRRRRASGLLRVKPRRGGVHRRGRWALRVGRARRRRRTCARTSSRRRQDYRRRSSTCSRRPRAPMCGIASMASAPSTASWIRRSYLDLNFFRALAAVRRAGRLRRGLCHRARGRPSRPEPARRLRQVAASGGDATNVGAGRAAGGLLRRRLGHYAQQRGPDRSRRLRGRLCAPPGRSATTAFSGSGGPSSPES